MQNSKEKYIVITGASSGIGREIAKAFAAKKKNLIITARREVLLAELKKELLQIAPEISVVIIPADLSSADRVIAYYEELEPYDIETFINNAGFGYAGKTEDLDIVKAAAIINVNVQAVALLTTLYVKDYKDRAGAQLINISSAGGYIVVPEEVLYSATKFFVSAFTEGIARELQAEGAPLKAKVMAPANTETGFAGIATDTENFNYKEAFTAYHQPEQVAQFVMQLWESDAVLGIVDRKTFEFTLSGPRVPYAG